MTGAGLGKICEALRPKDISAAAQEGSKGRGVAAAKQGRLPQLEQPVYRGRKKSFDTNLYEIGVHIISRYI